MHSPKLRPSNLLLYEPMVLNLSPVGQLVAVQPAVEASAQGAALTDLTASQPDLISLIHFCVGFPTLKVDFHCRVIFTCVGT